MRPIHAFLGLAAVATVAATAWFFVQDSNSQPTDGGKTAVAAVDDHRRDEPAVAPNLEGMAEETTLERAELEPGPDSIDGIESLGSPDSSTDVEFSVRGRVVTEGGAPIDGVPVKVAPLFEFAGDVRGSKRQGWETVTARDGTFELKVAQKQRDFLRVRASSDRFVPAVASIPRGTGSVVNIGDLVLTVGGSLSGRVVDELGNSVAGATVSVMRSGNSSGFGGAILLPGFGGQKEETTKTNGAGEFRIDNLGVGEVAVLAEQEGFTRESRKGIVIKRGEVTRGIDVTISRGGEIAGVVFDEQGRPAMGARVSLQETVIDLSEPGAMMTIGGSRSATTDERGWFELGGLKQKRYHVSVRFPGHVGAGRPDVEVGTRDLRFDLEVSGIVYGYVVDAVTDEPLVDFKVEVNSRDQGPGFFGEGTQKILTGDKAAEMIGVVDSDGLFVVTDLQSTLIDLNVAVDGYVRFSRSSIEVAPGGKTHIDAALTPGLSIAGRVVDPDGTPVAGARVAATKSSQGEEMGGTFSVRRAVSFDSDDGSDEIRMSGEPKADLTDENGWFSIEDLDEGSYRVVATHPEWAPSERLDLTLSEGKSIDDLSLMVELGGALEGHTYDADGNLLPNARVVITSKSSSSNGIPGLPMMEMLGNVGGNSARKSATSDEEGMYRVNGLAPGVHYAELQRPPAMTSGGGGIMFASMSDVVAEPSGVPVTVEAGETATLDLYLRPVGRIEGVVRDMGAKYEGATVRVSKEGGGMGPFGGGPTAKTDDLGRFVLEGLEPADYVLTVDGVDAAVPITRKLKVHARETARITIDLPGGVISGRVKDAGTGKPIEGVVVSAKPATAGGEAGAEPVRRMVFATAIRSSSGSGGMTTMTFGNDSDQIVTDAEGYYELKRLPAGAYDVSISGAGVAKETKDGIRVEDEERVTGTDFTATRGAKIILTGVMPNDDPIELLRCSFYNVATPDDVDSRMTFGENTMTIDGLAPGRYHFDLTDMNLKGSEVVDLVSSEEREVTIHLR